MGQRIKSGLRRAAVGVLAVLGAMAGMAVAGAADVTHGSDGTGVWAGNSQFRLDVGAGTYRYTWSGGGTAPGSQVPASRAVLSGVGALVRLADGTELATDQYPSHMCGAEDVRDVKDELGQGVELTVHHAQGGKPALVQHFWVYQDAPYLVTQVEVEGGGAAAAVTTNYLAPVNAPAGQTQGLSVPGRVGAQPQVLWVPYDNDTFVRYNNTHGASDPDSYEVTAIYDNASRHGWVTGSLDHDLWKTGIEAKKDAAKGGTMSLRVFAGAAGEYSRDDVAHGMVAGPKVSSPRVMVGYFADWRDGLEAFGRANAALHPPAAWDGGVVFGWNSWAAYGMGVSVDGYTGASDFIKKELQGQGFSDDGVVFINWDSGWNRFTEAQLIDAARHIHANGQKAGIYWSPFRAGGAPGRAVAGTDGKYTNADLILKGKDGKPLPQLDGGTALDPTHPAMLALIDWQTDRFVKWGYDFVKLDFLNFAAREGVHADPAVTTGVQAYNVGMKRIMADLDPKKIGRPFFVSLSIAPLFPAFGHARRQCCDSFGQIQNTEYLLNSATYGWWVNGTVYRYNDPDHIVLWPSKVATTLDEARTRLNASAIAGTVFIDSDDLANPQAAERARQLLTNQEVNAVARSGGAFRPVEGDTGDRAADVFTRRQAAGMDVALFNYDPQKAATKKVSLTRLGLDAGATCHVYDLWTKQERDVKDQLVVDLGPRASTILTLRVAK